MEWIQQLPDRLKAALQALLDDVENQEEVYLDAQNASIGQIWVAMAYMNDRLNKMEDLLVAQRKALERMDVDVDQHIDRDLEESLKRY